MRLPPDIYATMVRHRPLVSIDLIVRNEHNQMLLGLRKNRPAQNYWFVPGGVIFKNETRAAAFHRLTQEELGAPFAIEQARFLGVFEHFHPDNFSDDPGFGTHYIVLAYNLRVREDELDLPTEQHSGYLWLDDESALARADVHAYSKAYCGTG